ncbi:MAG: hypothetical protein E7C82_03245 [Anaerococcus hydrogenalis]|uniref:hypothetical protein n=1 Tax=Anaerococcus hydrogenalis TaxID=33029 RepID=UPI00290310EE|nr:hypothetical protein [Anaerococcus hydrogenalis]MDU2582700.1 hypothetical protein [Anaerococcus hydrogenalis]
MIEFFRNLYQNYRLIFLILEVFVVLLLTLFFQVVFIEKFTNFKKSHPYLSNLVWVFIPILLVVLINHFIIGKVSNSIFGVFIALILMNLNETRKNLGKNK